MGYQHFLGWLETIPALLFGEKSHRYALEAILWDSGNWSLSDWVSRIYRPTWHSTGHFGDGLSSRNAHKHIITNSKFNLYRKFNLYKTQNKPWWHFFSQKSHTGMLCRPFCEIQATGHWWSHWSLAKMMVAWVEERKEDSATIPALISFPLWALGLTDEQ